MYYSPFFTTVLLLFISLTAGAQPDTLQVIPLWADGAPGFESRRNEPEQAKDWWVKNIHNPSVTVYLPPKDKANGTAVLVCPGGGHRALVYNSEGRDAALYLNSIGVTAFVLKYRLFREENAPYSMEHVRQDANRAMRLIRSRAATWQIDTQRIGIMGFSAGGEVVAQVAYTPGVGNPASPDPVEKASSHPDFQILVYPGPLGIPDSLPTGAPPAFMVAAIDDECCSSPVLALLKLYHAAHIPAEAHIYAQGAHAFNMGKRSKFVTLKTWPQRLADWMLDSGLLE